MRRLCDRPACSEVASMSFGFDVDRLLVWLAPRHPDRDPNREGSLCRRHANAMVVPHGWTLDDRRDVVDDPADDPDATKAIPWMPEFDDTDDLDGVLAAESPLLARAFRGTGRPR